MKLHEYLKSLPKAEFERLASQAEIEVSYLVQLKCHTENQQRRKRPSSNLSKRLAVLTGGAVTLAELRPDIWGAEVLATTATA
jgi:hypothetical protein